MAKTAKNEDRLAQLDKARKAARTLFLLSIAAWAGYAFWSIAWLQFAAFLLFALHYAVNERAHAIKDELSLQTIRDLKARLGEDERRAQKAAPDELEKAAAGDLNPSEMMENLAEEFLSRYRVPENASFERVSIEEGKASMVFNFKEIETEEPCALVYDSIAKSFSVWDYVKDTGKPHLAMENVKTLEEFARYMLSKTQPVSGMRLN